MEKLKLTIDNLGMNGEGVARRDNKVYFVDKALIGEEVFAEVVEEKSHFCKAKIDKILVSSPSRTEPFCPYFSSCGGCNLQHLKYKKQLEFKTNLVKDTLKKVGNIDVDVLNTISSKNAYFYRNKGVFPVVNQGGKCVVGMFEESTHNIKDINQCFLMNDNLTKGYKIVKDYLENNVKGYDFNRHIGDVKFAVIRSINNQTLVCLVVTEKPKFLNDLYKKLQQELIQVGLFISYNTQKNSTILSNHLEYIDGISCITLSEFDIEYDVNILSFLQINNDIKSEIYAKLLSELKSKTVIDAYAGVGLLSAMIAKSATRVYSVEIVKSASNSAKDLAKYNDISNMEVINGDCAKIIPNITKNLKEYSIVLDPARVGCDEKVLDSIKSAKEIFYISCNPIALSKDLKILSNTHKIEYVQPFDMFPQTKQVETFVKLSLK